MITTNFFCVTHDLVQSMVVLAEVLFDYFLLKFKKLMDGVTLVRYNHGITRDSICVFIT